MREVIVTDGAFSELLACFFFLWSIGSAMMNGIAQSDMGKLLLTAIIFGVLATACLSFA